MYVAPFHTRTLYTSSSLRVCRASDCQDCVAVATQHFSYVTKYTQTYIHIYIYISFTFVLPLLLALVLEWMDGWMD